VLNLKHIQARADKIVDKIARFPFLFFLVWALLLSYEYWLFGENSFVRIHDNADSTLGAKLGLAHSIAEHGFSYWWHMVVSGADTIALAVVPELDTALFLIFPGWLAYGILMFVQRLVAGYFMFKLSRESLKLDAIPSIYAGLAYSLFAQLWFNVSWNGFTTYDGLSVPALPLIIWALHRIAVSDDFRRFVYAGLLGILFSVEAYLVFTFFIYPFIIIWLLVVTRLHVKQLWKPLLVFTFFWIVGELPAQIPALFNAPLSHRGDWDAAGHWHGWAIQIRGILRALQQNAVPLIVAFAAVLIGAWKHKGLGRVLVILCVTILVVLFEPAYIAIQLMGPGFIKGVQFDRVFLNWPFLFIISGAIGLDAVSAKFRESDGRIRRMVERIPVAALIPLVICAFVLGLVLNDFVNYNRKMFRWMTHGSNYSALFLQPQLRELKAQSSSDQPYRIATLVPSNFISNGQVDLMTFYNPAYAWGQGFETADGYVLLYPQRYQDFWETVMGPMFEAYPRYYHRFHNWGSQMLMFFPEEDVKGLEMTLIFEKYYRLEPLSLLNVRYIVSNFHIEDPRLELVSDGSPYLKEWIDAPPSEELFSSLLDGDILQIPLYIYENSTVLPRVFTVPELQVVANKQELMDSLSLTTIERLQHTVLVTTEDAPKMKGQFTASSGSVTVDENSPDYSNIRVQSDGGCYLIISRNYSPYWNATIDGQPAEIFPAYLSLQGVYVPGGSHRVQLHYDPPYALHF
jgi:Protein of unknown function (DUF6044)